MKTAEDLRELLSRIDRKGYPAYKDTTGKYQFPGYVLSIDHVQGDPFASPSKVSVIVSGKQAGFFKEYYDKKWRRIALQDTLTRQFYQKAQSFSFQAKGSGKSGLISVSRCGQEILERSACQLDEKTGDICFRLEIGFPANGRTVNARELQKILFTFLPECIEDALYAKSYQPEVLKAVIDLSDDQQYIREQIQEKNLVAFVANGSILPRVSGVLDLPMKEGVKFTSPESMEMELTLPHKGKIQGMGIRRGITLIVGGGYHGKSTLLKALEMGVYNHIAGDGREYVITDDTAVKIRAEDGRSVKQVDISMFISNLPNKKDTNKFFTEDASGSTSQAANVVEAMEAGTRAFLIDEDTSATNFMIRDELMQRVVHRDSEPITPFIDRVEELYQNFGISTILVAGSCGSYFHKADCIIQMNRYLPMDVTNLAKEEAKQFPLKMEKINLAKQPEYARCPLAEKKAREDRMKIKTMGRDAVSIDKESIDLRYVEQLADVEQVAALGYMVKYAVQRLFDGKRNMSEIVTELYMKIEENGMIEIYGGKYLPAGFAVPRKQEMFACLNRYRRLRIK